MSARQVSVVLFVLAAVGAILAIEARRQLDVHRLCENAHAVPSGEVRATSSRVVVFGDAACPPPPAWISQSTEGVAALSAR